jgi:hypothetical protein
VKFFDALVLSAALAFGVFRTFGPEVGPGPDSPPVVVVDPATKATAATYVYEKGETLIPIGVTTALNRLNREKNIFATPFEQDTKDGTGETPDQYKAQLAAALEAGLPALVIMSGDKVVGVVRNPQTEASVMEAVR